MNRKSWVEYVIRKKNERWRERREIEWEREGRRERRREGGRKGGKERWSEGGKVRWSEGGMLVCRYAGMQRGGEGTVASDHRCVTDACRCIYLQLCSDKALEAANKLCAALTYALIQRCRSRCQRRFAIWAADARLSTAQRLILVHRTLGTRCHPSVRVESRSTGS